MVGYRTQSAPPAGWLYSGASDFGSIVDGSYAASIRLRATAARCLDRGESSRPTHRRELPIAIGAAPCWS